MSTPIVYDYKGSQISFISGENVMVNATQMAKPFGKLAKDWLSNKSTKEFLSTLSAVRTISLTGLVDKVFKIISFLFGGLRNCCNFAVRQLYLHNSYVDFLYPYGILFNNILEKLHSCLYLPHSSKEVVADLGCTSPFFVNK